MKRIAERKKDDSYIGMLFGFFRVYGFRVVSVGHVETTDSDSRGIGWIATAIIWRNSICGK